MKSLSVDQLNIIASSILAVALILSVIAIYFIRRYNRLKKDSKSDIQGLTEGLNAKKTEVNALDIALSKLKSQLTSIQAVVQDNNQHIAELESKVKFLTSENAKLLKAASDDVTINIKAESVNVPVVNKKRSNFKRNKNAGSTTSYPKVGKGK